MSGVFELFGEEIAGVNNTRNVSNFGDTNTSLVKFADVVFAKIYVFGAFVGARSCPVDSSLVVVVNRSALKCI